MISNDMPIKYNLSQMLRGVWKNIRYVATIWAIANAEHKGIAIKYTTDYYSCLIIQYILYKSKKLYSLGTLKCMSEGFLLRDDEI